MKPTPIKDTNGEIVGFKLRAFVGRDECGKQITTSKTWHPNKGEKFTQKQIEKLGVKLQIEFEDEMQSHFTKDGNITFEAFTEKWMKEYAIPNNKKKTVGAYISPLKKINIAIGHIPLNKLKPEMINMFLNNLREVGSNARYKNLPLSDKSILNYYTLLSSILSTAKKWGYIQDIIVDKVQKPQVRKTKAVDSLTSLEVKELFSALEDEPLNFQIFIMLAIYSGMRNGEMVGLKWKDIDFKNCLIHIERTVMYTKQDGIFVDTPKTKQSNRIIKISNVFFDTLKIYKHEQECIRQKLGNDWIDEDWLFTKWNGAVMSPDTPYKWFVKFQQRKGLKHCTIHQLRHTTATLLIMHGVNIKLVSGRLGHSNVSTTSDRYASYLQEAELVVSDALDDILKFNNSDKQTKKKFKIVRNVKS